MAFIAFIAVVNSTHAAVDNLNGAFLAPGDSAFATESIFNNTAAAAPTSFNNDYIFSFTSEAATANAFGVDRSSSIYGESFDSLVITISNTSQGTIATSHNLATNPPSWNTIITAIIPGIAYTMNVAGIVSAGAIGGVYTVGINQVTAVPIPAAVVLFGTGLLGLIGLSRRKQKPTINMTAA